MLLSDLDSDKLLVFRSLLHGVRAATLSMISFPRNDLSIILRQPIDCCRYMEVALILIPYLLKWAYPNCGLPISYQ
jgi:hypothetical protein